MYILNPRLLGLLLSLSILFSTNAQITNEKIWSGAYYPSGIYGIQSMNNGKNYVVLTDLGLEKYSYLNQAKISNLVNGDFHDYSFNSNEEFVLLQESKELIYRHSHKGSWKVLELKSGVEYPIFEGKEIQVPTFSPDASKVAFVYENNLYYQDLVKNQITQITTDGKKEMIINGICDWVYEEEFGYTKFFEWNADGSALAYARFDESEVKNIKLSTYHNRLYPSIMEFKYPKAGEKNSEVSIRCFDLNKQEITEIDLSGAEHYYIPKIKFSHEPNNLFVITSNRHQNTVHVNSYNLDTKKLKNVFIEKDEAWVDTDNLTLEFLSNNQFVWNSERSGYRHLYLYSADGKKAQPLTSGDWEVTEYYGMDEKNGVFYYQSTQNGSTNRVVSKGYLAKRKPEVISEKEGFNHANFSADYTYFINTQSTANAPAVYTLRNNKGENLKTLEDNARLQAKIKEENLSPKEFFQIPNDKGQDLNAWMIKPADFSAKKKYPVLMYVYGGPGVQTVENSWDPFNIWWFQELAQKGYIVVSVDGRGTGGKGVAFKKCIYRELGKYEIEDQIAAGKWLGKQAYIDKDRIGMFGWSYGGYMTSLAMTKGADVFSTGIAVAPVTNWRFYDTIYTERFMRTPQENPSGYDENSPINHVDKLKGKYLLIHGTGDDNVHFQNTVEMTEALIQANKDFDLMVYPDKNHGIYGGNTRLHLYNKMTNFLLENL